MLAKDRKETVVGKVKGEGIVLGCILLDLSVAVSTNLFFLFSHFLSLVTMSQTLRAPPLLEP